MNDGRAYRDEVFKLVRNDGHWKFSSSDARRGAASTPQSTARNPFGSRMHYSMHPAKYPLVFALTAYSIAH